MYARRDAAGDRERAQPLVDAALAQFRTLGMPGWIRRAEALLKSCAAGARESEPALAVAPRNPTVTSPARGRSVQDKRIVTLVFTDMEGSTHLLGSLGDAFLPILERQRAILGAAAAAHGGTGYATGGDGCVFLFGSPSSAVAAAVEAQRALAVEQWPRLFKDTG